MRSDGRYLQYPRGNGAQAANRGQDDLSPKAPAGAIWSWQVCVLGLVAEATEAGESFTLLLARMSEHAIHMGRISLKRGPSRSNDEFESMSVLFACTARKATGHLVVGSTALPDASGCERSALSNLQRRMILSRSMKYA